MILVSCLFCFFKQKTAYEMRISDWSSDVCSSDLVAAAGIHPRHGVADVGDRDRPERLDQRGFDPLPVLPDAKTFTHSWISLFSARRSGGNLGQLQPAEDLERILIENLLLVRRAEVRVGVDVPAGVVEEVPSVGVCAAHGAVHLRGKEHVVHRHDLGQRSEEHTSELQSLMRNSYAVFCLKKKNKPNCTTVTEPETNTKINTHIT